jgi:N-acyl-D-aspartate/D-glutamate deacylase
VFRVDRDQGDAYRVLRAELAKSPLLMAGASDGGAHLQSFCGADYPTRLLCDLVPDPLTLEMAVHRLTGEPAAMIGLRDRGTIRPGAMADLVLFDSEQVSITRTEFLDDFPSGARRLVHRPRGYHGVIVGGRFLHRDGAPTGDLPGRVLRRTAA